MAAHSRTVTVDRTLLFSALLAAALAGACAAWSPIEVTESWTLYAPRGETIDAEPFQRALEPAFAAVEEQLGPFKSRVRVNAWSGGDAGVALPGRAEVQEVPGIGPARVRAFHVRGGGNPFAAEGVFLGTTEAGTVVHELVHARLAEEPDRVPLWFEEGLASLLGDGALFDGSWKVDGLVCWPLRELREQELGDKELRELLALSAREEPDARENLLVHFVGWAIVFDLAREDPLGDWRAWLELYRRGVEAQGELVHARARITRTLDAPTERLWLERLSAPDPGTRLAAAKGTWKLRSRPAVEALLEALTTESQPEVRYALALNAFLASAEAPVGRSRWILIRERALPVLRAGELSDEDEARAAHDFYRAIFSGGRRRRSQEHLEALARFWEE